MAKFLRILPAQQTTATTGSILLDPGSVFFMRANSNTTCWLYQNNSNGIAVIEVIFNSQDSTFFAHRNFCDAMCAAASDQKSSIYNLPPIIGGDGVARTISITYF